MTPAAAYFRRVAELLEHLNVTDGTGTRLELEAGVSHVVRLILEAKSAGKKILLVGNGGSSAIASHMQSDLQKSVGVRALVFHDVPLLTATVNDDGYENVFSQPLGLWTEPGDLLIALSSSGKSANILGAVERVKGAGGAVVTLSGFRADNPLRRLGVVNFWVSAESYGLVEAAHTVLTHYLTDCALESRGTEPSR